MNNFYDNPWTCSHGNRFDEFGEEVNKMDGRVYLNEGSGNKKEKAFIQELKKLGALYYDKEDSNTLGGVIVIGKKKGDCLLAIKYYINGNWQLGTLDEDCNNFDCDRDYYAEELKWLHTLFGKILSR